MYVDSQRDPGARGVTLRPYTLGRYETERRQVPSVQWRSEDLVRRDGQQRADLVAHLELALAQSAPALSTMVSGDTRE